MYLYGRIMVQGIQSWGFYKYNAARQRWLAIGGFASEVIQDVKKKKELFFD